ncbi:MAG: hypothetical protein ACRDGI_04735, partial [Candidatus Limnocylindrales bacterium]
VDISGLRWRWGFVPWVTGVPEKVVWLADAGVEPEAGVSIVATRLTTPILVDGHPRTFAGHPAGAVFAAATETGWADDVVLPEPGCWLLTATWSTGASSVVVSVAPPPVDTQSPSISPSDLPSAQSSPLTPCPQTIQGSTQPPQGWSGPAITDGPFRWLLPPGQNWRFGGDGDKLVLDSTIGWAPGEMHVVAIPLASASQVGWLGAAAVAGDIPPLFGGGTLGVGLTLPGPGCWVFVFLDPDSTSSIVDLLPPTSGSASPSAGSFISSAAAQAAALANANSTGSVTVTSATFTTYGGAASGSIVGQDTPVWAVRLSGTFTVPSCGGYTVTPHSCAPPPTSELVLIDAVSGAFIEGILPAPGSNSSGPVPSTAP